MSDFSEVPIETHPVDGRENLAKRLGRIYLVVSLVLSIVATSLIATSATSTDTSYDDYLNSLSSDYSSVDDTSWVPAGFNVWDNDSNIAWKWSDHSGYTCSGNYGCVEAQFVSRDGCPSSFYAAVNWLDKSADLDGAVIGYDNSTLPSLYSSQIAKMQFEDTSDNGKSAQMAEIDCR